jgi:hypothetical protein
MRLRASRPRLAWAAVPLVAGLLASAAILGLLGAAAASGPEGPGTVRGVSSISPAQSNDSGVPCNASDLSALNSTLVVPPRVIEGSELAAVPDAPRHPASNAQFVFQETGLAYETRWGVILLGLTNGTGFGAINTTNNTIIYFNTSGTYLYLVPPVPGYLQAYCALITVNNAAVQIFLSFTPFPQWAPPAFLAGIALWGLFVTAVAVNWVRQT